MGDARRGVEIAGRSLVQETFGELSATGPRRRPLPFTRRSASAHLLPIYDEYLIAYKDRGAVTDPASTGRSSATIDGYAHWLVVDGRFVGTWRREETPAGVEVGLTPHRSLTMAERKAVAAAANLVRRVSRDSRDRARACWKQAMKPRWAWQEP